MRLPDHVYSILKWVALLLLPLAGVAYGRLATVWKMPYGIEVAESCQIMAAFIGGIIGISTATYYYDKYKNAVETSVEQRVLLPGSWHPDSENGTSLDGGGNEHL